MLKLDFQSSRGKFVLDVQAELSTSGATAILGRNGSGKTSLLRALAGLDETIGNISINESIWLDTSSNIKIPTRNRNLGYVSQQPKLFPNMSVERNLEFAHRFATRRSADLSSDVLPATIARFDLKSLLPRKPSTLSGGETSRVVLARALLSDPDLLLLDEPLATIDIDRKRDFLPYLEQVLAERPIPMLYVTHDFTEVARLCTNALVLQNGVVSRYGDIGEVLQSSQWVNSFDPFANSSIVNATFDSFDDELQLAYFKIGAQNLVIPMNVPPKGKESVLIRVRERDVAISISRPKDISIRNALRCKILDIDTLPDSPFVSILLACETERIRAQITRASMRDLELQKYSEVFALIKSATLDL